MLAVLFVCAQSEQPHLGFYGTEKVLFDGGQQCVHVWPHVHHQAEELLQASSRGALPFRRPPAVSAVGAMAWARGPLPRSRAHTRLAAMA